MDYRVVLVDDDELPRGVDWALAREPGAFYAFIKRSQLSETVLSEAWRAYACMAERRRLIA